MYLDAFLEVFRVSDVTILFLLSLGIGLLPKLGGAIGLDDPVGGLVCTWIGAVHIGLGWWKGVAVLCMLD